MDLEGLPVPLVVDEIRLAEGQLYASGIMRSSGRAGGTVAVERLIIGTAHPGG